MVCGNERLLFSWPWKIDEKMGKEPKVLFLVVLSEDRLYSELADGIILLIFHLIA